MSDFQKYMNPVLQIYAEQNNKDGCRVEDIENQI
jgi:hypothetical protein